MPDRVGRDCTGRGRLLFLLSSLGVSVLGSCGGLLLAATATPACDATLALPADAGGLHGSSAIVALTGSVPAGTIALNASLQWDPLVLSAVTVTLADDMPVGWGIDFNLSSGAALLSIFGVTPISGARSLANIHFTVEGSPGSATVLDLIAGEVNEVPACLSDGEFFVCPTAAIDDTVRLAKTPIDATIGWTDPPGPYNVYRGSRAANAGFSYNHTCQSANVFGSTATDTDVPLSGQLFYYLVSRVAACGESSLGNDSSGAERPNDDACVVP